MSTTPDASSGRHTGTLVQDAAHPIRVVASPFNGFTHAFSFPGGTGGPFGIRCDGVPRLSGSYKWTLEAKVQLLALGGGGAICGWLNALDQGPQLFVNSSGRGEVFWKDAFGIKIIHETGNTFSDLGPHDLAATYDRSVVRLFIDGVLVATSASTIPVDYPSANFWIGSDDTAENTAVIINEVRWSQDARYTASYGPGSIPFVADTLTLALYHLDDTIQVVSNVGLRCQNVVVGPEDFPGGRPALFLMHRCVGYDDSVSSTWTPPFGGNENDEPWIVGGLIDGENITYGPPLQLPPDPLDPRSLHAVWEACYGDAVFIDKHKFVVVWHRNYGERYMAVGTLGSDLKIDLSTPQALQLWHFNPRSERYMAFGAQHLTMVTEDVGIAVWGFSDYWAGGNDRFRARAFRVNENDLTFGPVFEVPQVDNRPGYGLYFLPGPLMNLFKMGEGRAVFAGGRSESALDFAGAWERYTIAIRADATNLTLTFGPIDIAKKITYAVKLNDDYFFCMDNRTDLSGVDWFVLSYGSIVKVNSNDTFTEITSAPLGTNMYSIMVFDESLVAVGEGGDIQPRTDEEQPYETDETTVYPGFATHFVDIDLTKGTMKKWDSVFYRESRSQWSSQTRKGMPLGDGRRSLVPNTAGGKPYVLVRPQVRPSNVPTNRGARVERRKK